MSFNAPFINEQAGYYLGMVESGTLCSIIYKIKGERNIHTNNTVVVVASDMEPGAGIGKSRIPAHEHIVWVLPCRPLLVQDVTLEPQQQTCMFQKKKRLYDIYTVLREKTQHGNDACDIKYMQFTFSVAACKCCKSKKAAQEDSCCRCKLSCHCSV